MLAWLSRYARPLARTGCISIGTVYLLIGTFALFALSGRMIENADEERVIHVLMRVPGGVLVVWLIIAGIAGYVFWRAVEAVTDPYHFGSDWKGLLKRTAVILSALAYGLIGYSAARIALRGEIPNASQAGEQEQQRLAGEILTWPGGQLILGLAGAFVLIMGVVQFVVVVRRSYATEISIEPRTPNGERAIHVLAWYGYSARGVILCVLGYLLLRGAVSADPKDVGDTDTAFDFVGGGVVGDTAFAIVALGTVAYGVLMYVNAWHYRFEPGPDDTADAPPSTSPR